MTRRCILVVDDDLTNRLVVKVLLERRGFDICEASSGAAALGYLASETCDLVLMDLAMPGMDGFETTRRIRRLGGTAATVPIVALTAHTSGDERRACEECGMNGFLEKPFDLQAAMHTILFLLEERTLSRRAH